MDNKDQVYCAITEQGDLGLGAEVLCESDQEIMKKAEEEKTASQTVMEQRGCAHHHRK